MLIETIYFKLPQMLLSNKSKQPEIQNKQHCKKERSKRGGHSLPEIVWVCPTIFFFLMLKLRQCIPYSLS